MLSWPIKQWKCKHWAFFILYRCDIFPEGPTESRLSRKKTQLDLSSLNLYLSSTLNFNCLALRSLCTAYFFTVDALVQLAIPWIHSFDLHSESLTAQVFVFALFSCRLISFVGIFTKIKSNSFICHCFIKWQIRQRNKYKRLNIF